MPAASAQFTRGCRISPAPRPSFRARHKIGRSKAFGKGSATNQSPRNGPLRAAADICDSLTRMQQRLGSVPERPRRLRLVSRRGPPHFRVPRCRGPRHTARRHEHPTATPARTSTSLTDSRRCATLATARCARSSCLSTTPSTQHGAVFETVVSHWRTEGSIPRRPTADPEVVRRAHGRGTAPRDPAGRPARDLMLMVHEHDPRFDRTPASRRDRDATGM